MPQPITLFEYESKPFAWTDRDCALLERMRVALGTEVLRATVSGGKRALQAAQHVGVIRLGYRTVQVLPKIYKPSIENADEKQKAKESTANLLRMLTYAGEFSVREHELANLLRQTNDWFEILTRLFASHLREEWQRGAHRTYQIVEDELPVLRGKWRIGEQLRRPMRRHIFSVSYDQFTADNQLNRVFRYVVERLWHRTRDHDNRQLLGELRQWMEGVTLMPRMTVAQANPSQLTRLNERYRPLLNLARLFLENAALQLAADDLSAFAFMFDMNLLFESFIASFIRRHSSEILSSELQACDFLPQSRGANFHLATSDAGKQFRLKPDIAFRQGETFPLLIDTKYKRLDQADRRLGVSGDDFYQMHAYAHRYDCPKVVLLYPQMAEATKPLSASFKIENCERVVNAASINLCVDLSSKSARQQLISELKIVLTGA